MAKMIEIEATSPSAPSQLRTAISTTTTTPPAAVAANPDPSAPPVKRRAPIACRSDFPSRGDLDQDRLFRHPRQRADKRARREREAATSGTPPSPGVSRPDGLLASYRPPRVDDEWALLPGVDAVVASIEAFTRHYYQLGFIPKKRFPRQVRESPATASGFLLLAILAVAARFDDDGRGGLAAAAEYMRRAQHLAIHELYQQPTLERCQAFYLLSIAEQGSGKSNTSYISAGIAFRMAALMRLHREEAYSRITAQSPIEHRIRAESARRTFKSSAANPLSPFLFFPRAASQPASQPAQLTNHLPAVTAAGEPTTQWMLHSQDNLTSGPYKPSSLAPSDITALLPSDEAEFEAGRVPALRAALAGTPPALRDPALASLPSRSLFASLMQAHDLWGTVARRVLLSSSAGRGRGRPAAPDHPDGEYARLDRRLRDFERALPRDHVFSTVLLSAHRYYAQDLAYLGLTGCIRLCHIVLRKEMIRLAQGDPTTCPEVRFYKTMAEELFFNVRKLYEQIEAHFEDGVTIGRVGSQMAGFIIYGCGLLASYLCKFPQRKDRLLPHAPLPTKPAKKTSPADQIPVDVHRPGQDLEEIRAEGRTMYARVVAVLRECQKVWPLAETWCNGLEKWHEDANPERTSFEAGTMTDGKEPQPYALSVMRPRGPAAEAVDFGRLRAAASATPPTPTTPRADDGQLPPPPEPAFAHQVYLPPLAQGPAPRALPPPYRYAAPSPPRPLGHAGAPPAPPHAYLLPHHAYPLPLPLALAHAPHLSAASSPSPPRPYSSPPPLYYAAPPPPTTTMMGAAPGVVLDDGFDSNLQMLVDGAGGPWMPAADEMDAVEAAAAAAAEAEAGALYAGAYDMLPSYLP
ncbi:hypothetical protein GGS23DRAFT_613629 [Durotheca rogersii]|uniref:uncharacterized protein n=1 Tax=Durotheca rogersii TaxID=419775 RepID=UPI00221E87E6|nr:uncharacterized protein GGS23DRAFT_613629 [Durotheca rogersii]KAI5860727.1 hypothetical protein GGS23DRAFT_613629 [Durotheca rogersii]